MKKTQAMICLVVLCVSVLVSGCTDNKALQEIRDQMQAEKEQKEIEARAASIIAEIMRVHEKHINATMHSSEQRAREIGAEKDKLLDDIERRAANGDKAAQLALLSFASQ